MINSNAKYKRVFLIGVDGAGAFFNCAETPRVDRIFGKGAVTYSAVTAQPSISAECWGSMLIGVMPEVHGLTNSKAETMPYPVDSPYPTLMRRLREAYPECVLASFSNWSPINTGIIEGNAGVHLSADGDDGDLTDMILEYLEREEVDFMFVQFDSVDCVGHEYGYGAKEHLDQLAEADTYIGRIYDTLEARGLLEDALFIVTADHGGTPEGSHGGDSDAELKIFFGAAGKSVVKNGRIGEMCVWDIPAVIMYALGLDIPSLAPDGFAGQIPAGLFEDYVPEERVLLGRRSFIHTHKATPEDRLGEYVDRSKIAAALFFDGNANDSAGGNVTETCGKLKFYSAGYYGECAELGSRGFVKIPGLKLGQDSFSLSVWIKRDFAVPDGRLPTVFATRDREMGGDGVAFSFANYKTVFEISAGGGVHSVQLDIPVCYGDGWTNITLVADREENTLTQYVNFDMPVTRTLPDELRGKSFDGLPFTVGNDCSGTENDYMNFFADDFIVFRGALTRDEVAGLDRYYNL